MRRSTSPEQRANLVLTQHMPQLLERAYNGLEVINETHRTTAALGMLASAALPLVSEKVWPGGQKHLVPLLDLSLPGIDLVRSKSSYDAIAY